MLDARIVLRSKQAISYQRYLGDFVAVKLEAVQIAEHKVSLACYKL